jgi:tetratricopeptide (TPR) repeat protein
MKRFTKHTISLVMLLAISLMLTATGCGKIGGNKDAKATTKFNEGVQAYQQGSYSQALQVFQEVNKKYPKFYDKNNVDFHIIMCQSKLGQNAQAIQGTDLLMAKQTTLPPAMVGDLLVNRGNLYYGERNFPMALNNYEQVLSSYSTVIPNKDEILTRAAECCRSLGQEERARSYEAQLPGAAKQPIQPNPKDIENGEGGEDQIGGDNWIVQCGVFKDSKNADSLVSKLGKAGLKAKSQKTSKGYRVYVGPTTKDEARSLAPKAAKAGAKGAFPINK